MDFYFARSKRTGMGGGLASPGLWAVRGEHLSLLVKQWARICEDNSGVDNDEACWTELVRKLPLRKKAFESHEVVVPELYNLNWEAVSSAAYVTVPDWPPAEQQRFLQSLYLGTYFGDETGVMLNILDA